MAPVATPTPEPDPEEDASGWTLCSKAELNEALEASPSHKTRIAEWLDSGALEFRTARRRSAAGTTKRGSPGPRTPGGPGRRSRPIAFDSGRIASLRLRSPRPTE
jgi:hypothetical protein